LAINTPIQGSAADIMKKAMIDVHAALARDVPSARLLLQVHDELVLEVDAVDADRAVQVGRSGMMNALTIDVPLVVDAHVGQSWGHA
jgi:DNA polymerase-1